MVVNEPNINNIMSGIENTGGVKQHNHKKKLKQRFDLIRKLGQGTFGKVQLGINKETGQEVAIKTIKKSKIESEADLIRIRREIQIMSSVQHPNIIHIYEVFENKEKMVLVMEYAAGGELYDYLSERKVLDEEEARRIFRQIATACYYCHKHKICHRDLKLENILLDTDNNAKIADFGLSNVFDDQRLLNTFCGSPLYASPEIVKGTPYNGPEVDCWSLGVLLYTLVYGAMPFDGSNFKRLVKQISQGDYFEPAKPSAASPLIRDMLTVNPKHRANIEKICAHWWVNETYNVNCLEISEELANQTPVRLDLLLSLAPPPPQLESDKLVVTKDEKTEEAGAQAVVARSQSAGSMMEMHPSQKRIQDLMMVTTPKRKLESTISQDHLVPRNEEKRKEKIVKENTVADISVAHQQETPLDRSATQTISKEQEMDVEVGNNVDLSLEGAACAEIIEESKRKQSSEDKQVLKRLNSNKVILEGINEIPSQENSKTNISNDNGVGDKENCTEKAENEAAQTKIVKKKVKKKVLSDAKSNNEQAETKSPEKSEAAKPTIERRRSRIFEAAEKFQNMISPPSTPTADSRNTASIADKPKKIIIPGVSVDGFKKEFERKASLTSVSPPKILNSKSNAVKKVLIDQKPQQDVVEEKKKELVEEKKDEEKKEEENAAPPPPPVEDEQKERVRNAVNIISSALDKEGARKSKSRPCCMRKPPVPFGVSGRSASGNIGMITTMQQQGPKPFVRTSPVRKAEPTAEQNEIENKTSSAEITLKSATLPRSSQQQRKTTKAEIQLNYPIPKAGEMEFKTEMAHNVEAVAPREVVVPLSSVSKNLSKERIIPIAFENVENVKTAATPPPAKPPIRPTFVAKSPSTKTTLSRQSTQESDTESSVMGEPIKKSPREYIIPIAVEGGGYVTPRAGSLEPSECGTPTTTTANSRSSRSSFGRGGRRINSLLSDRGDSEDESHSSTLHRHHSFGKDSDTEDGRKDIFRMHRLRSTRPKRTILEHGNDSLSSGEEEDDDDDDGFEILTAEHLFSNLLSRVRDLTQKLNVEDGGGRPGFPSSRLLSHFDHDRNFWNFHNRLDPLTRHSTIGRSLSRDRERSVPSSNTSSTSMPSWKRSVSRDLATDIENVFRDPAVGAARPRDNRKSKKENLNLAELDLKNFKLSDEDALALSYLTPGLSRRIQKHLFSQLQQQSDDVKKKLQRTLSSCDQQPSSANYYAADKQLMNKLNRRSVDRISTQRYSTSIERDDQCEKLDSNKYYRSKLPSSSSYSKRATTLMREPSATLSRHNYHRKEKSPDSTTTTTDSISMDSNKTEARKPSRKVSRFLRPDFFDPPKTEEVLPPPQQSSFCDLNGNTNVLLKEKKEREMETQKVLKEIRDKRKMRLNSTQQRQKSVSREKSCEKCLEAKESAADTLSNVNNCKSLDETATTTLLKHDYVNVPKESVKQMHDYVNLAKVAAAADEKEDKPKQELIVPKKTRISKLIRPKSYPTETLQQQSAETKLSSEKTSVSPEKESKLSRIRKGFTRQSSKEKDKIETTNCNGKEEEKPAPPQKNKLLQSIEKKLEKFRSNNKDLEANKEKKSSVERAINRLREQSLPRNLNCSTESGLIKRAVSVEDLTLKATTTPPNCSIKPSRKSVTKILGLFKKYEEQQGGDGNKKLNGTKKKKMEKSMSPTEQVDDKNQIKVERPKSLLLMSNGNNAAAVKNDKLVKSKLPVNSFVRRSLNLETKEDDVPRNAEEEANRNSVATDDTTNSVLLSPSEDNDTWSICSDYPPSDLISPVSPVNGHYHHHNYQNISGDESESVIDRIRRKSFYTRFNENLKRPTRKNLMYGSLDRRSYASDYKPTTTTTLARRNTTTSYLDNSTTAATNNNNNNGSVKNYKTYRRSASLLNDYVNVPSTSRYQTYSSSKLARPMHYSDENGIDDLLLTSSSSSAAAVKSKKLAQRQHSSVSPINNNNEFYH